MCDFVTVFSGDRDAETDGTNDDDRVTGDGVTDGVLNIVPAGVGGDAGATAPPMLRVVYGYSFWVAAPTMSPYNCFANCSTRSVGVRKLTVKPTVVCFLLSVYVIDTVA